MFEIRCTATGNSSRIVERFGDIATALARADKLNQNSRFNYYFVKPVSA